MDPTKINNENRNEEFKNPNNFQKKLITPQTPLNPNEEKMKVFVKFFLGGIAAGISGTVVGHPLDLVKVRLQTQNPEKMIYSGTVDCFSKIVKNEGIIHGLFKGLPSPLVGLTVINAASFSSYGQFKLLVQKHLNHDLEDLKWYHLAIAGGLTGSTTSILSSPFEFIKIRMQLDNITNKQFKNSFQCALFQIKNFGIIRGLYFGGVSNLIRETIFATTYFAIYEELKKYFIHKFSDQQQQQNEQKFKHFPVLLAGGLSGASSWFVSFPVDVIKSNIQKSSSDFIPNHSQNNNNNSINQKQLNNNYTKKGMIYFAKEIYKQKGIRGFYNGLTASVGRAFLVSSTRFYTFELTLEYLSKILN